MGSLIAGFSAKAFDDSVFFSLGSIFMTLSFNESRILSNLREPMILFLFGTFRFVEGVEDEDEDE